MRVPRHPAVGLASSVVAVVDVASLVIERLAEGVLELTTGNADISADGDANFTGPIELRSNDRSLSADTAHFDRDKTTFTVDGEVRYTDALNKISGSSARYVTETGEFYFADTEFELRNAPASGSAKSIHISADQTLELHRTRYTSCPAGNNDWELKEKDIEIDSAKGMGTSRGATL